MKAVVVFRGASACSQVRPVVLQGTVHSLELCISAPKSGEVRGLRFETDTKLKHGERLLNMDLGGGAREKGWGG